MKQKLLYSLMCLVSLGVLHSSTALPAEAAPISPHQAIARPSEERTLLVYPNPSTGVVHLTISGLEGHRAEISIINVLGTVMYHETITELNDHVTKTLDLNKFANGLYYVKLEANNATQLCKLIISN